MRICYIGDGDSVHNHFMVDWFRNVGHEILFLTDTPDHAPHCEVIPLTPYRRFGPLRHLLIAQQVRQAIQTWKPDIVHAHNVTGYGYWGALCGFQPLVMTAWGTDLNILAQKNFINRSIVSYSLRQARFITADAEALCQTARTLAGNDSDIRQLQWGVDLKQFNIDVPEHLREKYRRDADWVFLSTRRLREIYNIDIIIRAFADVHRKYPKTRLIVVGEDVLKNDLLQLRDNLGLGDAVLFTGWLPQNELLAAIKCADAFVSVPSSDSTALSLLEAFAAELPVIVSDLEANREWIEHKRNGWLVPPRDVDTLAEAMDWMVENPSSVKAWTEINRLMVKEKANRDVEMKKIEGWYRRLIG